MHRHPRRFVRAAASAALLALGLLAGCGTYTSGGYYSSGYYSDPAVAYGYPYYRSPRYYYGGGPGYYYGHPHYQGWHGGGAVVGAPVTAAPPVYVPSQPGLGYARPVVSPPPVVRPATPVFSHPVAMPPGMARPPITVAPAGGFHR